MWWIFDSDFPRGSIFYFDVNFLELVGPALLGPVAGYVIDTIRIPFPRRALTIVALLFFIIGFGCQLAYRSPVDDQSRWTRDLMAPAYAFTQLAATFLEIASRSLLTDLGFVEGQALAHGVGGAMACVGNLVVYTVVRLTVTAPAAGLWEHGWDPAALRKTQVGLAIGSALTVVVSMLSPDAAPTGPRAPVWTALFNVDRCPHFWRIAVPYAIASCGHHQILLLAPAVFHMFLGCAIEGYVSGFWLGFAAIAAASGLGAVVAVAAHVLVRVAWLRTVFVIGQTVAALALAAFSYACWDKASLVTVYVFTGAGFGLFKAAPFAFLGDAVPRDEVGRCVSLMIVFAEVCEQIVQADYWDNSMDIYYPWPRAWIFLIMAGFLASAFPVGGRNDGGESGLL
jgi:hypothetical protein